ncbi:MAG: hypothetical protein AAF560_19255 [Acidobacteriota bacterium]
MSISTQRALAILALVLWMSPNLGAIGLGVHLALEHHDVADGHHDHGHHAEDCGFSALAEAATHGHHHAAAAPEHEHESRIDASTPTLRPSSQASALWLASVARGPVGSDSLPCDASPRRGPPLALFTAHCSLLL